MIEYKIKEGEGDVGVMEKVIVKSGDTVEFTLAAVVADEAFLEKSKKEMESLVKINKATMENVTRTHPHVAAMSAMDLTAAYLFREAMGKVTMGEEKIKEIQEQIEKYAQEKAEIEKQTGLKVTTVDASVETPNNNG